MIKLFLADDRPVVLGALNRIVAEYPDMCVAGAATSRGELLGKIVTADADLLLLDVSVAGPGIFALLRQLKKERPTIRVLVLGVQGEDQHALRVLGTGAAAYLTRDHSASELVAAIRRVVRGATFVSSTLAQRLVLNQRAISERPRYEALSDREYQVLCMFGSGRAFSEIAAELGVSRKTVSTYRSRVLHKLRLTTNADLIRYAVEHRLVL
ncbi:MAG TPA: response regulator transcription factor [Gemmatimonadales bacterium]|nr:response regulator transcription factor [Gemmatimonadales bacterium]